MTRHSTTLTWTFQVVDTDDVEREGDLLIQYDYHPAQPAYTPRGEYAPIDPPEPAQAEIVGVWLKREGARLTPAGPAAEAQWQDAMPVLNALFTEQDWAGLEDHLKADAKAQAEQARLDAHPEVA